MNIIPFQYQGIAIQESCWIDGTPFFTGRAIGEWIEAKHPDRYVHQLVSRHSYIKECSINIKLPCTADGKKYDVDAYDITGLTWIMMASKLPKATNYQIAYAQFICDDKITNYLWEWAEIFLKEKVCLVRVSKHKF